jgi:phage baseplate assembly protein W
MAGLSPKLPLRRDFTDGYALNKNFRDLVKQNFKMLLLTIPGERMMMPKFGVGLKRYLFELNTQANSNIIQTEIRTQVRRYLPFINLEIIDIQSSNTDPTISNNFLSVSIRYRIEPLGNLKDVLTVNIGDL